MKKCNPPWFWRVHLFKLGFATRELYWNLQYNIGVLAPRSSPSLLFCLKRRNSAPLSRIRRVLFLDFCCLCFCVKSAPSPPLFMLVLVPPASARTNTNQHVKEKIRHFLKKCNPPWFWRVHLLMYELGTGQKYSKTECFRSVRAPRSRTSTTFSRKGPGSREWGRFRYEFGR